MSEKQKRAVELFDEGFNCAQSVIAVFANDLPGDTSTALRMAGGFGHGLRSGEVCGAISGAVMTLGLLTPADPADPAGSKKRSVALSKELQKRFSEKFGALRCRELLQNKFTPDDTTPAAKAMGLTGHCDIMIVTAVEIVEELLAERA